MYQTLAGYYSLQDSLKVSGSNGLDLGLIQFLMLQLTSAAQHLHSLNIVYLNWTSGNILSYQSEQGIIVKLCNFSTAACADYYDVGFLKLALPTHILMPELCNENKLFLASDIWGMGCLLFELVTGYPVWHDHRHNSSEELCKMMKENFSKLPADPAFNLTSVCPKISPVVSACWEMDPNKRISLVDLQIATAKWLVFAECIFHPIIFEKA
ncbi:hypothetical protein Btru_049583 [Bulinus truncatus]|nr:hypothetical protein Btru_049583 [Bulinus truncatus]